MANKRYMCRTHQGGIFSMPPRKGRPPVRCTPEHPCDKQETPMEMKERTSPIGKPAQTAAKATAGANDSLPLAMAAKARLEPLEWVVKGRAWIEGSQHFAEVVRALPCDLQRRDSAGARPADAVTFGILRDVVVLVEHG